MAPTRSPLHVLCGTSLALVLGAASATAQTFAPKVDAIAGTSGANCVVTGDLNGDGYADVIVCENTGGRITWAAKTQTGFGPPKTITSSLSSPWHIAAGDLDQDGDTDVAVAVYSGGQVYWYENLDHGASWVTHDLNASGSSVGGIKLVDLNGDALPEIVATSYGSDEVLSFANLGGGNFGPRKVVTSAISGPWALGHGDLDGDGDQDLLIGSWLDDQLYRIEFQGGVPGVPVVFAPTVDGPSSLGAFDLDGDGDLDVLSASRNDSMLTWFENHGPLATWQRHDIGSHSTAFQADAADIDDDGDLDVFVAANGSGDLAWHEGLGLGLFGPSQLIDGFASGARYVHLDDLDGDSDADVLCANYSAGNVGYFENLLPTKKPKLFELDGLHCVESGTALVLGKNLLGTSAWVDGQPVPVANVTESRLELVLDPDVPGGLHDVTLANSFGSTEWPEALRRYPVIELPGTVPLGEPVDLVLDNGEPGAFVLAYSGALFAAPAPFTLHGWYHGLELNGVWMLVSGAFTAAEPSKTLSFSGLTDPFLQGIPIHLQAWTAQTDSGHAGFTAVATIVFD